MTPTLRVYLAGPEVFLRDPYAAGAEKKRLCATYGFEGCFPLDNTLDLAGISPRAAGLRIAQANEALMQACDLIIANMTPFRGPSMDPGTAYEMGFMRALGKPVFGYTNSASPYAERVLEFYAGQYATRGDGSREDPEGNQIEEFELCDNLMMAAAVELSGAPVAIQSAPREGRYTDLRAFEQTLAAAAAQLRGGAPHDVGKRR